MNAVRSIRRMLGGMRRALLRIRLPVPWFLLLPGRPVSRSFGFDRGKPVDRLLIERFIACHASDVRGCVLEVGDREYTTRYGGNAVEASDVLHAVAGNPAATVVGNLATGEGLKRDFYDCIILTQTLHVMFDVHAAVRTVHDILKPGGVALLTIPGITQVSRYDADRWGDYWRMTPAAVRRLLEEAFPPDSILISSYGNVRMAAAMLYGLAVQDVPKSVFETNDPDYPLLICARVEREKG